LLGEERELKEDILVQFVLLDHDVENTHGLLECESFPIRPVFGQCLENVQSGHGSALVIQIFSVQPLGVSTSIQLLMMVACPPDDIGIHSHDLERFLSIIRMLMDDLHLFSGEGSRLVKDRSRHYQFADIMQQGGQSKLLGLLNGEPAGNRELECFLLEPFAIEAGER